MEVKKVVKNLKISTKKLDCFLSHIRGKNVEAASELVLFSRKRIAKDVSKALKSSINDIKEVHGIEDYSSFYIKEAYSGKGLSLKRIMHRAKGRVCRIKKVYSHMTIILQRGDN